MSGKLRLHAELAPGLPNLMVDRLRFKQVLLNLLLQRDQVHPARRACACHRRSGR